MDPNEPRVVGRASAPVPPPPGLRPAVAPGPGQPPPVPPTGRPPDGKAKPAPGSPEARLAKLRRRYRYLLIAAIALVFLGSGVIVFTFYVDSVPTPDQLALPESTTVYYADGRTPMAKLGTENRTILHFDEMSDAVKQTIVAAEDQTFWTNKGIDFGGVMRAAWNNVTGGQTQGASTITQQYARVAADLKGVTYSRKLREAVIAWKLARQFSKEQILEFYLNTVPFGRGAYGIEAAAQSFFGKTANKNAPKANQLTVSEAMVLVSMVKQPEAHPEDPEGQPGYDPTRGPRAEANSRARWTYVRDQMVALGYLNAEQAAELVYPDKIQKNDPRARQSGLDLPTGLVVNHVLSELRQTEQFRDKPKDYIQNGGFRIITTIDKRAQDVAEATADIRRDTTPPALRGQPKNWQAALVAVEPGTGRVLAYYGGSNGAGADYAGWYRDDEGEARGFGQHPPGSSFKVYDLAEALRQKVSVKQRFDSPASKEFPASGRTRSSPAGPVRNAGSARCQPNCMLWEATVASLNVTFFGLTEQLGVANVIDMAIKSGVDAMWTVEAGNPNPVRVDVRGKPGQEVAGKFSTEVGIGQYGITVLDHANGMATFAANGQRAEAHFVRQVTKRGDEVYNERISTTNVGLDQEQIDQLNWTLSQVAAAKLPNGWDSAGKTGTWQFGESLDENAHTWMVGYTKAIAAAVWVGTTDGKALTTKNGSHNVVGATYPGPVWRQFMVQAAEAMALDRDKFQFGTPKFPGESASPTAPVSPEPEETEPPTEPSSSPTPPPPPPPPTLPPSPTVSPPAAPGRSGRRPDGRRSRGRRSRRRRPARHG